MSGNRRPKLGPIEGDINSGTVNNTDNSSGPSIGRSSLVIGVKSMLLQEPLMQRNDSISNESCMPFLTPSMPFSPNTSGSLMMEGSSIMQQNLYQEVQKKRARIAPSQTTIQEPVNMSNPYKNPRSDMRQNMQQQQVFEQLLQRREPMQPLRHQTQAMQQQRLMHHHPQQQQVMQCFPNTQKTQQQGQMRQHMQRPVQLGTAVKHFIDSGICSRRLMQYLYHQRNRPSDNSIQYWRKFVTEYFTPQAKKRLCVSTYNNYGNHKPAVFPQSAVDPWQCNMCGAEWGRGYEVSYTTLPQLFRVKFEHNLIDEHLFLNLPHEYQLPSGIMVLEYENVAQESVYEHHRVIHKGQLRIMFAPELKILSWEFCVRGHEEFLSRKLLLSQANQLLQIAQKYRSSVDESGSVGVSKQDLQASCDMLVATSCQLAKQSELQNLNDMGFSNRYIRYFQIYGAVSSMTDLIDFSKDQEMGPIESLKNYPQLDTTELRKQKMGFEQLIVTHGCLSADQRNMDNPLSANSGMRSHMNNNLAVGPISSGKQKNVLALIDNQNFVRSTNSKQDAFQHELSSGINTPKQLHSMEIRNSGLSISPNRSARRASRPRHRQHQMNGKLSQKNNLPPAQGNQQLKQHLIQPMMLQVVNESPGAAQQCQISQAISSKMTIGDVSRDDSDGTAIRKESISAKNLLELQNMPTSITQESTGDASNRSNSFKNAAGDASRGGSITPDSTGNAPNRSSCLENAAGGDVSRVGGVVVTAVTRDSSGSANDALELQNMPSSITSNSTGDAPDGSNTFKTAAGSPTTNSGDDFNLMLDFPEIPPDLDLPNLDDISMEFAQNGMFEGDDW